MGNPRQSSCSDIFPFFNSCFSFVCFFLFHTSFFLLFFSFFLSYNSIFIFFFSLVITFLLSLSFILCFSLFLTFSFFFFPHSLCLFSYSTEFSRSLTFPLSICRQTPSLLFSFSLCVSPVLSRRVFMLLLKRCSVSVAGRAAVPD